MGANDTQIKQIVAAGQGAGDQVIETLKLGYTNQGADFDPTNLLAQWGTDAAGMKKTITNMPSQTETALDDSSSGTFFSAIGDAFEKPDKVFANLGAMHSSVVQQMLETDDQEEIAELKEEEKFIPVSYTHLTLPTKA